MMDYDPAERADKERSADDGDSQQYGDARAEVDDIKWLMSNRRGRRIAFRWLERSGLWRLSFNTNALAMAFNEGERNAGLRLQDLLVTHSPERYAEMLQEHKK